MRPRFVSFDSEACLHVTSRIPGQRLSGGISLPPESRAECPITPPARRDHGHASGH